MVAGGFLLNYRSKPGFESPLVGILLTLADAETIQRC
jgi:hypothetical protein